jgi:hypothetical protein
MVAAALRPKPQPRLRYGDRVLVCRGNREWEGHVVALWTDAKERSGSSSRNGRAEKGWGCGSMRVRGSAGRGGTARGTWEVWREQNTTRLSKRPNGGRSG